MDKTEIIKLAAEAGVTAAIKFMDKEYERRTKAKFDRRLRNTRLLLSHYPMLAAHSEKALYSISQLEDGNCVDEAKCDEDIMEVLEGKDQFDNETYIQSIKRSATRTHIILAHIQEMMAIYQIYCERSGKEEDPRRYRVLQAKFFDQKSNTEIAVSENVDERTVRRDINEATQKLSALIFGIDGLTGDVQNVSFTRPSEL